MQADKAEVSARFVQDVMSAHNRIRLWRYCYIDSEDRDALAFDTPLTSGLGGVHSRIVTLLQGRIDGAIDSSGNFSPAQNSHGTHDDFRGASIMA